MAFADKLKHLRQERGLSQAAFAESSGIPLGSLRDYEQGKREPLLSNAQRLADALDVPLDVFREPARKKEGKGRQRSSKPSPRRKK